MSQLEWTNVGLKIFSDHKHSSLLRRRVGDEKDKILITSAPELRRLQQGVDVDVALDGAASSRRGGSVTLWNVA
jgi:hypothetical protein